jgi:hypothetical protein
LPEVCTLTLKAIGDAMNEDIRPFLETAEAYDINAYNRMAALGKSFLSELGNHVAGGESTETHMPLKPPSFM